MELFKTYALKSNGQSMTLIHTNDEGGVFRHKDHVRFIDNEELEQLDLAEVTEPDFKYHRLNLLEALKAINDAEEDLRYIYNVQTRSWYHMSASGQFHIYEKPEGCEEQCWLSTPITLELLNSLEWAVPKTVIGYMPIDNGPLDMYGLAG